MPIWKPSWDSFTSLFRFGSKGTEKTDQAKTSQSNDWTSEREAHSKQLDDAVRENSTHLPSLAESLVFTLVKKAEIKRLADAVKQKSTLLEPRLSALPIYKIPLKEDEINVAGCRRFSFGKESSKHNRTIMVLGATGAGKSTLINGMINYILGVEWKDDYRFKLVDEDQSASQAHSQTSEVTVYKIHHQDGFQIPFSLTIVDTPGFGDTRGIEKDREIVEQLRRLFSAQLGVSEIDAVCFVAQAALARLTPTQKYVFDSVLSIFGKDVAENIRILVTFADGQRPPVLEAINAAGVPCPKTKDGLPAHFKFNNSALFANNKSSEAESMSDDEEGGFDKMFWEMGTKSMKKFFAALNLIETKSLTLTKEVLRERNQLEISVENLQVQVKLGLAKMEEIKETSEKVKEHEAEISRNENFEFEVTVIKPFQEDISRSGNFITNCQQCCYTCHHPCGIPNDADKIRCWAIGGDGYCTQCPGRCYWNVHFNQKYKWEYKEVKEKKTIKELKENYLKATGQKMTFQGLLDQLNADYHSLQAEVVKLMERSAKCLNRLKEIALKPNPLSTPEYIDMLIEGEKSEGKSGWKKRVEYLMSMKEKAEYMAKVEKGEDLLQHRKTDLQQQNTTNRQKETENQDEAEINSEKPDSVQEEAETNKQDPNEVSTNADHSEIQTNEVQDKAETDSNQDQIKVSINADYDKTKTIIDQDEAEMNSDESDSDGLQDETKTYSDEVDSDGVQEEAETNKHDPNEVSTNTDHSEIQTNEVQDEAEINSDESDSDGVQEEAETETTNQD